MTETLFLHMIQYGLEQEIYMDSKKSKLIIEDNTIYEIDFDCLKRRKGNGNTEPTDRKPDKKKDKK